MRGKYAVIAGVLLVLQSAVCLVLVRQVERTDRGDSRQAGQANETRLASQRVSRCVSDDGHLAPVNVDDQLLRSALIRQSVSLMDRGLTVDAATLAEQLESATCQLETRYAAPRVVDPAELFRAVQNSVVVIGCLYKCENCMRWHVNTASGFVIGAHGAIATNYHVVDSTPGRTLVAMTADRHVYPVLRVLAASRTDDLAILQVAADDLQPLPLADGSAAAPVGSAVSIVSHPDGRFFCYTAGVVSRYMKIRSAGAVVDAMAVTAEFARGSSGAPVINSRGEVVAVVSATESIYYSQEDGQQRNLQMVFRTCVPVASLQRMLHAPGQLASRTSG